MSEIAESIWDGKYRFKTEGGPIDVSVSDTFNRIAVAIAAAETTPADRIKWGNAFYDAMKNFEFIPAGRIIAGAGTGRGVTLFNCFVMGTIADDLYEIQQALCESAMTMKEGGGIGNDFSPLRPKGALVKSVGSGSSGPVSFMHQWDAMCRVIMSAGARRGAMMGTLRCDHPDIEEFVEIKRDPLVLRNFNISILITQAFMDCVASDSDWPLIFDGKAYRTISARGLWDRIMRSTYDFADPGVIFIDEVNGRNPLRYCETISCTNPCGEEPLPPYGNCNLASINLARLVINPFTPNARLDQDRIAHLARVATRFLDNVIDVSRYPLEKQRSEALGKRRIGIGITGLADALAMLGLRYSSEEGRAWAALVMRGVEQEADQASQELGEEKGDFPLFDAGKFSACWKWPVKHRRNSHLTSIAPTGTISLFAGNVSSGIEPIFDYVAKRKILEPDGSHRVATVKDYAISTFHDRFSPAARLPEHWQTTADLTPMDHLRMVAAVAPFVDSAVSKTINVPKDIPFADFEHIYKEAHRLGLKGCTTFRPNDITGSILSSETMPDAKAAGSNVVAIAKPIERGEVLVGATYKIKPTDDALYVTINDIVVGGQVRPFEIFINTKNLEHAAALSPLTRMVSAIFRKGGDVAFVADELKAIHDARGGFYMGGAYVPSISAAIGGVIERHFLKTGFLGRPADAAGVNILADSRAAPIAQHGGRHCPKCHIGMLVKVANCWQCATCDYTKC